MNKGAIYFHIAAIYGALGALTFDGPLKGVMLIAGFVCFLAAWYCDRKWPNSTPN